MKLSGIEVITLFYFALLYNIDHQFFVGIIPEFYFLLLFQIYNQNNFLKVILEEIKNQ